MVSQLSRLTGVLLIAIGTASQASPSFAQTVTTGKFPTPRGEGTFTFDPANNKLNYSIGDSNSPFSSSGEYKYDLTTSRGTNNGTFKEDGTTGSYTQDFPLFTFPNLQTIGTGTSISDYLSKTATQTYNQYFPPSVFQALVSQLTSPSSTGTVTRPLITPQGGGIYTWDDANKKFTYSIGDPNGPVSSSGVYQGGPGNAPGTLNISYKDNGTTGGYTVQFSSPPSEAVPEPNSGVLNTLAFGAVVGTGLMFKQKQKNRK